MLSNQYTFPKLSLSTNQSQLKFHRQKLLQEHYQQQIKPNKLLSNKMMGSSSKNPGNQYHFLNQNDSGPKDAGDAAKKYRKSVQAEIIKNSWAQQLDMQIALKQRRNKEQKQKILQNESYLVRSNSVLSNLEVRKQKQFLNSFKQEALQNYQQKQLRKKQQKNIVQQQKNFYHNLYVQNHKTVENMMQGANHNSNMARTPSVQNFKIGIFSSIDLKHMNPEQSKIHHENIRQKQNLKQTLLQQIRHSNLSKQQKKEELFSTPYIKAQFKQIDHPILNPIDMKIAKDNPYIMKELLSRRNSKFQSPNSKEQDQGSNTSSYLSRRGSTSLLTGNKYF